MRKLRALLVLSLWAGSFGGWVTGCGGDDSSSSPNETPDSSNNNNNNQNDGSSNPTDSGGADTSTGPSAKANNVSIYLGNVAKVDGSSSTGPSALTYDWKVTTPAAGSAITTASLVGANTATPTFTPDKLGVYQLELTVSASGSSSKTTVTVTVLDPPIFFWDTNDSVDDAGANIAKARMMVNGTTASADAGKPVACFDRDSGTYSSFARHSASAGTDWWEAPAGDSSKVAFLMEAPFDGGQASTLFAATSTGSCAAPPTKLDSLPPSNDGNQHAFEQPRISPDGKRVAYARWGSEGYRVATVGMDGAGFRILSPRLADQDGGADPDASPPPNSFPASRPFWVGTTHVAWIETVTNDLWQVVRVADAANPTRELVMKCNGSTPQQGAILANGEVLVSQQGTGGLLLIAYPVNAGTKMCNTGRVLTPYVDGGFVQAQDFAVSPDEKQIAYLGFENDPDAGSSVGTRIVKVDGTSPPREASPGVPNAIRGPRWSGSGAFVSWQQGAGGAIDAGFDASVIMAVRTDGGGVAGFPADGDATQSIGNGIFNCGIGNAAGSGAAFFGIGAVAALRLVRRRRR